MTLGATIGPLGLCPPLLSRPALGDAQMIYIPGISGVAVGAGATGAEVSFLWPQRLILRGWILVAQSGDPADVGNLSLRIVDQFGECVFDGQGVDAAANFLPALAGEGVAPAILTLTGWARLPNWQKIGRLVTAGEQWKFQVMNAGGAPITPRLAFEIERPL